MYVCKTHNVNGKVRANESEDVTASPTHKQWNVATVYKSEIIFYMILFYFYIYIIHILTYVCLCGLSSNSYTLIYISISHIPCYLNCVIINEQERKKNIKDGKCREMLLLFVPRQGYVSMCVCVWCTLKMTEKSIILTGGCSVHMKVP